MLPLAFNGRALLLPTRWEDVTVARYIAWASTPAEPDPLAPLAALLGVPPDELARSSAFDAPLLLDALAFLSDPFPVLPPVLVGGEAYLAVEEASTALRAATTEPAALPAVWARLTQRREARATAPGARYEQAAARAREAYALTLPCTDVIPEARALLAGLAAFFEYHADLFAPGADADVAEEAGADRFELYGSLNTVIALAGPSPTGWDDVYHSSADSVYLAMRHRRDSAEYQKDYAAVLEIRQPNA